MGGLGIWASSSAHATAKKQYDLRRFATYQPGLSTPIQQLDDTPLPIFRPLPGRTGSAMTIRSIGQVIVDADGVP
jgi:hypothetical protein